MAKTPKPPPPEPDGGPETLLPGERSGEGSEDIFRHIQRDIRRKVTGLPVKRKPEEQQE